LLAEAIARGVPVLATYGMTESFGQLATARSPGGGLVPLRGVELIAGTRVAPAPIRVRAPMLATRYLDAQAIAPEHVTSDLGFVESGAVVVAGRADDMIITGGENVSPTQVEAALVAMPGVRAACAFGIPDEKWGQIVAAAVVADSFDLTAIAKALPVHARPRELAIVRELPMLATGKLDRRAAARLPRERVHY
jgi:O-succinylbenzoic acid--CoA ligase